MVVYYESCPPNLLEWVQKQHVFWVATAPLKPDGHVNVSPKGAYDCFHVINPNKVWYEDLTGSGNETISHIRENGRITVMFMAFDGPPRIVRFFGTGKVYEFGTPEYEEYIPLATRKPGSRAAIVVDAYKVSSSCGYTVPYYEFKGNRTMLLESMQRREIADEAFENENKDIDPKETRCEKGIRSYWVTTNATSLDGLPGIVHAPYAKEVPRSPWTLEKAKQSDKALATSTKSSEAHVTGAKIDAKLMAAFSAGVVVTALFAKLGGIA